MSDYPFHSAHLWINFKRRDFPRSQTILNASSIKPVVLSRNGKMENILDWKSQIRTQDTTIIQLSWSLKSISSASTTAAWLK